MKDYNTKTLFILLIQVSTLYHINPTKHQILNGAKMSPEVQRDRQKRRRIGCSLFCAILSPYFFISFNFDFFQKAINISRIFKKQILRVKLFIVEGVLICFRRIPLPIYKCDRSTREDGGSRFSRINT